MASTQSSESTSGQLTDSSTCGNESSGVLFADKLPKELREMIHPNSLALLPGIIPPTILGVVNEATRVELLDIFHKINYAVRKEGHDRFRKIPIHKFLLIRHLTLIHEGTDKVAWLGFKADKSMLMNKLTTVTFDLTNYEGTLSERGTDLDWVNNLSSLILASSKGITKITFVLTCSGTRIETTILRQMKGKLGFESNIEPDLSSGRDLHVLVWEASKDYLKAQARISHKD
ncbi:hypothetical protein IFR05_010535 [Cadophora sp. M221]|nr:hypothetical protein IFR05_010535 [Cadophora sp. M221]